MTMMNAAARGAVVAQELAYDLRHMEGAATAEAAAIYALPGGAAPVALLQMFREAARQKQDETAQVVFDHQARLQELAEEQDDQDHAQQLQHYREGMHSLIEQSHKLTDKLDGDIALAQAKHDEHEVLNAKGQEMVVGKDGKSWVYAENGQKVEDKDDIDMANAERAELERQGLNAETLEEHQEKMAAISNAKQVSADAKATTATSEAAQDKNLSQDQQAANTNAQTTSNGNVAAADQKLQASSEQTVRQNVVNDKTNDLFAASSGAEDTTNAVSAIPASPANTFASRKFAPGG